MALTSAFADCGTVLERCTLVNMINRPAPSSRRASVTSPGVRGLLTSGFTLVTLATAALNTPVAHAEQPNTDICDPSSDYYIGGALCGTPTPAPSSGGSGGGFSNAVSDFIGSPLGTLLFFGGIAAFIGWVVIASRRDTAEEKEKRNAAELARGRAIAEQHHLEQVQQAHAEAAAAIPPREEWDPMNMGAVPPTPEPVIPAPPSTDPIDLQRYTVFGAVTPWETGTAFAAVVSRDGSLARATAAWLTAAQAAGLGEVDEAGTFTPSATLTNVRYDDGDVEFVVQPAGLHVAEKQLDKALPYLVVEARVERATPFVREAATGRYVTTLTNRVEEAAPAPEAAPVAGPESWEW
ncbi:hypothetical protein ABFV47_27245 [Mycolicibacterium fortuitum]|uniref:hypothetical protein n=1 Tax=Mycolicibacterium fortuitum TaxID=1766 RepID=UPI0007EA4F6F|nr:hypothetical protein [Mycolicibacterium fortuitum]OBG09536.1 hypothetical protein A5768_15255 [Mycolicibacterium fortuitum]